MGPTSLLSILTVPVVGRIMPNNEPESGGFYLRRLGRGSIDFAQLDICVNRILQPVLNRKDFDSLVSLS